MAGKRLLACWGNGDFGRLGHGSKCLSADVPQIVTALQDRSIQALSCGAAHTATIEDESKFAEDGSVYSMGLNDCGQLGHSADSNFVSEPREVLLPEAATKVSAGSYHTLFLTESGDVWSVGSNSNGQLGLGNRTGASPAPRRISALAGSGVVGIAAGDNHSLAVTSGGEVLSWGSGSRGQLGHGASAVPANKDEFAPRLISSLRRVSTQSVYAGGARSGCTDNDRRTWTWGENNNFELGHRNQGQSSDPVQVGLTAVSHLAFGGSNTLALFGVGAICRWGGNEKGFSDTQGPLEYHRNVDIPGCIEKVACGWKHSAAVTTMGNLYCWGWGGSQGSSFTSKMSGGGQLGLGDENDHWKPSRVSQVAVNEQLYTNLGGNADVWKAIDVSCGLNHTAAIVEILDFGTH